MGEKSWKKKKKGEKNINENKSCSPNNWEQLYIGLLSLPNHRHSHIHTQMTGCYQKICEPRPTPFPGQPRPSRSPLYPAMSSLGRRRRPVTVLRSPDTHIRIKSKYLPTNEARLFGIVFASKHKMDPTNKGTAFENKLCECF